MKNEFFLINLRSLIVDSLALIVVYSQVVLYILAPMIAFFGTISIFFSIFPLSWMLLNPQILSAGIDTSWLNLYISGIDLGVLSIFGLVIFMIGFLVFLISFVQLTRGLVKEQDILTKGFYKHVRHPQNLAIILMAFPVALYVPGFQDLGIRLADIIFFVQFTFIVMIYSDWEERRLIKKYPDKFLSYYRETGFLFPKLFSFEIFNRFSLFQHPYKRYIVFLLVYIIIINSIYLIYISGILDIVGYF
ncbi:MAG: methyltransferase family protein [Candidatus Hodarchaeales archaeon]